MRLLLAGLLVSYSLCSPSDVGYELLYQSSPHPVDWQCWPQPRLPEWINGSFLLPSVGLFEFGAQRFEGVLDGFGKLHRFQLDGPNALLCMHAKLMQTGFYNQSVAHGSVAPSMLFRETEPPRSCGHNPMCNVRGPNDNVFVNSVQLGETMLQLTDSPSALQVDSLNLDILGKFNWSDKTGHLLHMGVLGSAHPLRVPGPDGELITLQIDVPMIGSFGGAYVDVLAVKDSSPHQRRVVATIHADVSPYVHSYGVTKRFVVLPLTPIGYNMEASLKGQPMVDALESTKPNHTTFHLIPLDGSAVLEVEAAQAFTYSHVVNAFDNGTSVIFDACSYTDASLWLTDGLTNIPLLHNKTARDLIPSRAQVVRFTLDIATQTVSTQALTSPKVQTDFPKVSPLHLGQAYCVFYAIEWFHNLRELGSMAVLKKNVCTNTTQYWYRPGWYPSEASFLNSENPKTEDDGVVLFSALDGAANQSYLVALDATTMNPLFEQLLPVTIPFTTHGQFYSTMGKPKYK